MKVQEIINGLKFTIIMFMQDPITGEVYTKPRNELDKISVDACKGAIKLLENDYISIADAMSAFDDFMCNDIELEGQEVFLELLKDRAERSKSE